MRIMAHTDGIAAHFFELFKAAYPDFFCNGGTECTGWVECSDLVTAGEDIIYQASSGVGPFNAANDPSSAWIGVYVYDENNVPVWTDAQFGEVPQD